MKKEYLNNKKQEWVTPMISQIGVEDTEGKQAFFNAETTAGINYTTFAPS